MLFGIAMIVSACAPRLSIPMPAKVEDYSGYASGNGYAAQFKIKNNGNVMIYSDAITGTVMLVRDKQAPIFRGKFRDGVNIDTYSSGHAVAYGNMAYGNTNTSTSTSSRVRDITVIYAYGDNQMKVSTPKHSWGSTIMKVTSNTKQDFSSWHKQIEQIINAKK